jgi:hypothetical protein
MDTMSMAPYFELLHFISKKLYGYHFFRSLHQSDNFLHVADPPYRQLAR